MPLLYVDYADAPTITAVIESTGTLNTLWDFRLKSRRFDSSGIDHIWDSIFSVWRVHGEALASSSVQNENDNEPEVAGAAYVLTQPCQTLPIEESSFDQVKAINDQIDKWNDDDYFCRNHILSGMTHSFYDKYSKKSKTAKELWDTLKLVYQAEEASTKKFLILNYMDFKMTDDRHISVQVRELQLIANDICVTGMVLDENFHVGAIVAKLPPTWNEYRNKLKHNKKYLALDQLMQHLQIEEETSNHENELAKEIVVKAHVVVDKDEKKNSGRAGSGVLICLYVDDMLIFGTDIDKINEAKNFLTSNFSMKDLGEADVILGIKII
ncbi:hypothetical protein RJ639_005355 [Escallonia herrerae]|uniref:Reverse transcriptase Ty1/copia-type domain-containing protein n=1 Tax=Escallonia herrerae TaxID=1293975 RepID=A0AA88VYX8_9ASTE|nr:hypothetical protein RJ639_005355 [Escallonia herrerae]